VTPRASHGRRRRTRGLAFSQRRLSLLVGAIATAAALSLGVGANEARPAASGDALTIRMLVNASAKPAYDVLIPNFERVYRNVDINVTYTSSVAETYQIETTQLAAGNAPELLQTSAGCGTPIAVCTLAKSGHLAPMVKKPWAKRSLPLVTSLNKYGPGLFSFTPIVAPHGVFTNDDLFRKLGLKIPQTFSQLLTLCRKAKAAGTVAVILPGLSVTFVTYVVADLAVATVYGKDKHWAAALRAGKTTFSGTRGWHEALQRFVEMNNAGCFQPGVTGTHPNSAFPQFAQGRGLMLTSLSSFRGNVEVADPSFRYSFHPFPGGTGPDQTRTFLLPSSSLGVNAHSSAGNQAAAQSFIDFIARPKQDALYAQITGGLTQYEFLKGQIPGFMSDFADVFKERRYVLYPIASWWNANVLLALQQNQIGLITGQRSIDDVLHAMDDAWKQGQT
jgi:raffinose/stachyose/melibiose transport system substrate-binding protein